MVDTDNTATGLDDDAPLADEDQGGLDEFAGGAAANAADDGEDFDAYLNAGKVDDVDKVRELIPQFTRCKVGMTKADLATPENNTRVKAGHEYIYAKFEVNAPEQFADGEHGFGMYFRLSTKANDPNRPQNTAWAVSRRQLVRIAAAIYGCEVTDPRAAQFDQPALVEGANTTGTKRDRRLAFYNALLTLIREEFVGKEFETEIGVSAERTWNGRKFSEQQEVGAPQYPGCERRIRKSARRERPSQAA
jgi:hypothetical protein